MALDVYKRQVCLSTGELTWGCVGMESEEACGTRRTERVENQTNQQNKLENRLIRCILDAGEVILKSGGEINRVEAVSYTHLGADRCSGSGPSAPQMRTA